ncbi:MAG: hypothetical protein IT481_09620 [Gammaproteobacteria bacterium]|nr:hypothetical protein [Gammaproteobacteria bacterium]
MLLAGADLDHAPLRHAAVREIGDHRAGELFAQLALLPVLVVADGGADHRVVELVALGQQACDRAGGGTDRRAAPRLRGVGAGRDVAQRFATGECEAQDQRQREQRSVGSPWLPDLALLNSKYWSA